MSIIIISCIVYQNISTNNKIHTDVRILCKHGIQVYLSFFKIMFVEKLNYKIAELLIYDMNKYNFKNLK